MPTAFSEDDKRFMQRALELAKQAEAHDEVPVGAVLVKEGEIIAEGWNQPIGQHDPTAHAEIQALRAGGQAQNNYRLINTTLYVTLEPCAMCAMAIVHARVSRVVYAAKDLKTGAAGSVFQLLPNEHHNHSVQVDEGLMSDQASSLMSAFFARRRAEKKAKKRSQQAKDFSEKT